MDLARQASACHPGGAERQAEACPTWNRTLQGFGSRSGRDRRTLSAAAVHGPWRHGPQARGLPTAHGPLHGTRPTTRSCWGFRGSRPRRTTRTPYAGDGMASSGWPEGRVPNRDAVRRPFRSPARAACPSGFVPVRRLQPRTFSTPDVSTAQSRIQDEWAPVARHRTVCRRNGPASGDTRLQGPSGRAGGLSRCTDVRPHPRTPTCVGMTRCEVGERPLPRVRTAVPAPAPWDLACVRGRRHGRAPASRRRRGTAGAQARGSPRAWPRPVPDR